MDPVIADSRPPYLVVDSPHELARWRPLAHWLLVIPHAVIASALRTVSQVVFVVYWVMFVVTGKLHPGLYGVMVMYERYDIRTVGYLVGVSEVYPPFDFDTGSDDDGAYPPVRLTLPPVPTEVPRGAERARGDPALPGAVRVRRRGVRRRDRRLVRRAVHRAMAGGHAGIRGARGELRLPRLDVRGDGGPDVLALRPAHRMT